MVCLIISMNFWTLHLAVLENILYIKPIIG